MDADPQVGRVAALLADATRSRILWALSDGRALPACDLALQAGVTPSTVSFHLAKLVYGNLVAVEKEGRHRHYRLASPGVFRVLESLATVAPPAPARSFREGQAGKAIRFARTCYDHLAGALGVRITEALVAEGGLALKGRDYVLRPRGEKLLARLGVDLERAHGARRAFARPCLDWSERRFHLAGALGTALLDRLLELEWIERSATSRAVHLRARGVQGIRRIFKVDPALFEQLPGSPVSARSPWTRKLAGMAAGEKRRPLSDEAIRRAHLDHLTEKHR